MCKSVKCPDSLSIPSWMRARTDRKEAASRPLSLSRLAAVPAKRAKPGIPIGNCTDVSSRSCWYNLSRISCSPLSRSERTCLPSDVLALKGERDPMSELDDFLTTTLARQVEAEEAFHNGDVEPRLAMWSTRDPVT